MQATDTIVQNYFSLMRTPILTEFFYLLSVFFDFSLHFFIFYICVAFLIYLFRGLRHFFIFLLSILSGGIFVFPLKNFFDVTRPDGGLAETLGSSFPSGHTTIATIFSVCLMYSFNNYLKGTRKIVFNLLCIMNIALVGLSRIYLGVHWFSDVVSGVILGALVSCLVIFISNHVRKSSI
jgi:membrane-associated phospholipid phosphatase